MKWLALILSLPTESAAVRQRTWRTLKSSGAAVLRDGVYLMPELLSCRETLDAIAQDLRISGGQAHVFVIEATQSEDFVPLFNRSEDFRGLIEEIRSQREALDLDPTLTPLREARKLRKVLTSLIQIDFFENPLRPQAERGLDDLETLCKERLSPGEPTNQIGEVEPQRREDYRNSLWVTRAKPWVDRLASAWLIRRFIDTEARILWCENPSDCPAEAIGFDFDGATFSHQGHLVTFEVLARTFGLNESALNRLGDIVHFLDVGGIQPPEAPGLEKTLSGLRINIQNDDDLLTAASFVFDALLTGLEDGPSITEGNIP